MDVAKTRSVSVCYWGNSLRERTGNFFGPSREYQGKIRDLNGWISPFLRLQSCIALEVDVDTIIGSATMRDANPAILPHTAASAYPTALPRSYSG